MNKVLFVSSDVFSVSLENGEIREFSIDLCEGFKPELGDNVQIIKTDKSYIIKKIDKTPSSVNEFTSDELAGNTSNGATTEPFSYGITVDDIKEEIYMRIGYRTVTGTNKRWSKEKIKKVAFWCLFVFILLAVIGHTK